VVLHRKQVRLKAAILPLAIVLVACEPSGATSTRVSQDTALPTASAASPGGITPSPTPPIGLVGRVAYAISCGSIIDDHHRRWEIKWTGGYAWGFDAKQLAVISPDDPCS
jgi:hypothetical protein